MRPFVQASSIYRLNTVTQRVIGKLGIPLITGRHLCINGAAEYLKSQGVPLHRKDGWFEGSSAASLRSQRDGVVQTSDFRRLRRSRIERTVL